MNAGANEDIIFPGIGGDDINGEPSQIWFLMLYGPRVLLLKQWNCVQRVK